MSPPDSPDDLKAKTQAKLKDAPDSIELKVKDGDRCEDSQGERFDLQNTGNSSAETLIPGREEPKEHGCNPAAVSVVKKQAKPESTSISGSETQPETRKTDLPALLPGIITAPLALISFLATVLYSITEMSMPLGQGNTALLLTVWLSISLTYVFSGLHCWWFYEARKKVLKQTALLLPECTEGSRAQSAILALLPLSWVALLTTYFYRHLYFDNSPLVTFGLPFLLFISALYWIFSVARWPFRLQRMFISIDSGPGKKARDHRGRLLNAAGDPIRFPRLLPAFLSCGFLAVPYLWYWKRAIVAVRAAQEANAPPKEVAGAERSLVIRYRYFAAVERWVNHRFSSSTRSERFRNGAIAVAVCALSLVTMPVWGPILVSWFGHFLPSETAPQNAGTSAISNLNCIILTSLGIIVPVLGLIAISVIRNTPTHFEFTSDGFRTLRWREGNKVLGPLIPWSDIKFVRLVQSGKGMALTSSHLEFARSGGNPVRMSLGSIDSMEDREKILKAIERWAPTISREADVVQALQVPADHSYTDLWLQALTAPPQRDRLKPLTPNAVVGEGQYRVKQSLGVGGQGAAYEAVDLSTGETVVLKEFLLPVYVDLSVRKEVLERFESEARILKHLDHPQIVKLIHYFVEDHRAYLVLEHIDGLSLREVVARQGPLPEARVRELACQMCTILSHLHKQDPPVLHRDFTPENLMLRNDGLLKLIDFNVAKQVESTATGSVVGKPNYLPPEQFRGEPVRQSDIYGMGATLYFLLTGEDPEAICVSHPKEKVGSISSSMDNIVAHATAIELKDRYTDCDAVSRDLEQGTAAERIASQRADYDDDTTEGPPAFHKHAPQETPTSSQEKEASFVTDPHAQEDRLSFKQNAEEYALVPGTSKSDSTFGKNSSATAEKHAAHSQAEIAPELAALKRSQHGFVGKIATIALIFSWITVAMSTLWFAVPDAPNWFDVNAKRHRLERTLSETFYRSLNNHKYGDVIRQCDRVIAEDPTFPAAHTLKAESLVEEYQDYDVNADRLNQAADECAKAAQLAPSDRVVNALSAYTFLRAHRYDEALKAAKASIESSGSQYAPGVPTVLNSLLGMPKLTIPDYMVMPSLAKAHLHLGQYRDAIAILDDMERNELSTYMDPITDHAIAYEMAHDPEKAIEYWDKQYGLAPDGTAWRALAPWNRHRDLLKQAQQQLKNGDEQTRKAWASFCDGLSYNALQDYDKAIAPLNDAINSAPDIAGFYIIRADCLRHLEKYGQALSDLDRALALDKTNMQARYLRARTLQHMGSYYEALSLFNEIADAGMSDSAWLMMCKAQCLASMHYYDQALQYLDRALAERKAEWDSTDRALWMKILTLRAAHRPQEALKLLDANGQYLFSGGNRGVFCYLRGSLCNDLGRTEEANKEFGSAKRYGYTYDTLILPQQFTGAPESSAWLDIARRHELD